MAQERARPDPEVKRRPWRGGGASGGAWRNGPPGGCGGVGRPRGPGRREPAGGRFLLLSPPEASGGAEAARSLPSAPAETPPALQFYLKEETCKTACVVIPHLLPEGRLGLRSQIASQAVLRPYGQSHFEHVGLLTSGHQSYFW